MDAFARLVALKREEKKIADAIKLAQEEAILSAMEIGKTGQVAVVDGAKITFKLVAVKPNTPMMRLIQEDINDLKAELEKKNANQLYSLRKQIEELTTSDEILELEIKLAQEIVKNQGEKKPQIAVTLPKESF